MEDKLRFRGMCDQHEASRFEDQMALVTTDNDDLSLALSELELESHSQPERYKLSKLQVFCLERLFGLGLRSPDQHFLDKISAALRIRRNVIRLWFRIRRSLWKDEMEIVDPPSYASGQPPSNALRLQTSRLSPPLRKVVEFPDFSPNTNLLPERDISRGGDLHFRTASSLQVDNCENRYKTTNPYQNLSTAEQLQEQVTPDRPHPTTSHANASFETHHLDSADPFYRPIALLLPRVLLEEISPEPVQDKNANSAKNTTLSGTTSQINRNTPEYISSSWEQCSSSPNVFNNNQTNGSPSSSALLPVPPSSSLPLQQPAFSQNVSLYNSISANPQHFMQ